MLRIFGSIVMHPRLWHVNRHSAALGAASGVFWAWICLPVQTIGAVISALVGKGNAPIAMAFTWVSNPLTWVPCFWLAYEVGLPLTPAKRVDGFKTLIDEAMSAGIIDGLFVTGRFLIDNLPSLYPMYVGGLIIGAFSGSLTYLGVSVLWRWHVGRRWRARHHQRWPRHPKPVSRGFGALSRLGQLSVKKPRQTA
jgi:uncharacterized protein (DUF2062 family)